MPLLKSQEELPNNNPEKGVKNGTKLSSSSHPVLELHQAALESATQPAGNFCPAWASHLQFRRSRPLHNKWQILKGVAKYEHE
jgi:hypothetical protein